MKQVQDIQIIQNSSSERMTHYKATINYQQSLKNATDKRGLMSHISLKSI